MKHKIRKEKEGGIAVFLLILSFALILIVATHAKFSANNSFLTRRSIAYQTARQTADNTTTMGAAMLHSMVLEELGNTIYKIDDLNSIGNTNKWRTDEDDFKVSFIHFERETTNPTNININIIAGVENSSKDARAAIQATYRVVIKSFFDYAIFTDGIFELSPYRLMVVTGKARANGVMRLAGSPLVDDPLLFTKSVWASDGIEIFNGWATDDETSAQQVRVKKNDLSGTDVDFLHDDGTPLESSHADWVGASPLRWGENQVRADAPALKVPLSAGIDPHLIIEPPKPGENKLNRREKMAYKDKVTLIAVNKQGIVRIKTPSMARFQTVGRKPTVGAKNPNTGVYDLTGDWAQFGKDFKDGRLTDPAMLDRRATDEMRILTIHLDGFLEQYPETQILHVTIRDENGSTAPATQDPQVALPVLRLRNGHDIGSKLNNGGKGLTVVTHRTTFIEGNYNVENKVPAAIMADNLTVLSNAWNDNTTQKRPKATESTYNFGLITGGYEYDPDIVSDPIEGLHNLIRYREDWKHVDFNFTGSQIKLWNSKETFANAGYGWFRAPNRHVTYDTDFQIQTPPGIPIGIETPELVRWKEISYDKALAIATDDGNNGHGNDPGKNDPSNPGNSTTP